MEDPWTKDQDLVLQATDMCSDLETRFIEALLSRPKKQV